jgi:hypothetical protein
MISENLGAPTHMRSAHIVAALEALAAEPAAIRLDALARTAEADPGALAAALRMLTPFGVLRFSEDGSTASVTGEEARNLLLSFAAMLRNGTVLVDDWHRQGSVCQNPEDLFERGVCLLHLIEKRRSSLGTIERPIRFVDVSKAIIKSVSTEDSSLFLLIFNDRSHHFQMVGGTQRPGESPEKTLHRELREELPHLALKDRDYTADVVEGSPFTQEFVSPTHGALTSFHTTYFRLTFHRPIAAGPGQRWVTVDELVDGKTTDGIPIVPSSDTPWLSRAQLAGMRPSVSERLKIAPVRRSGPVPKAVATSSTRLVMATLCGAALLAITFGAVSLAMRAWREHLTELLAIGIPTLILILAFVGLAAGLIRSDQFVEALRIAQPAGSKGGADKRVAANPD